MKAMNLDIPDTTSTDPVPDDSASDSGVDLPDLRMAVFALFFIFGGITSLNDVIIPKLKGLFTLSYAEAMLVQSAFFAAYFVVSLPGAALVRRIGYMRTAALGLLTMTAGCLLFIPASSAGMFIIFLGALFVLASGITIVQVVANPLISLLGVFPYVGSIFILGALATVDSASLSGTALDAFRAQETRVIVRTYFGLAIALTTLAGLVWLYRKRLVEAPSSAASVMDAFDLLRRRRFAFGALCIFLYVGAEVAIGSLIVNYLMEADVLGVSAESAGKHVPLYWGGAMVGRFVGAWLLRLYSPGKVLAVAAATVILLLLVSANTTGTASGWSLLCIGLFNSIMFPTIFSLACEGLGKRAAEGSGLICVAIVGGAIVPLITGGVADVTGLKFALGIPAICYMVILAFGVFSRRSSANGNPEEPA
jgi:FHS family L-fucose permease-like MFS transporter